jgi:hypothetical protein
MSSIRSIREEEIHTFVLDTCSALRYALLVGTGRKTE